MMLGVTLASAAASFSASLDRDSISVNESATLTVLLQDATLASPPAVTAPRELTVAFLGQSSQFNIINGQSSATLTYTYRIRASRPGEYTIPPASAVLTDGRAVKTEPLALKVLPAGQAAPGSDVINRSAFLQLIVPKKEVYLGEVLPVEIRLYAIRANLKQPPQIQQAGFTAGKLVQQPAIRTTLNNQLYNLLVFKTYVAAARTGPLVLGPATMPLAIPAPNSRLSFLGEPVDWMDVDLVSDQVVIDVRPLPTNGVPAGFTGAVGQYSLGASISTNVVTVGDPITLTVKIAGTGLIDSLALTSIQGWSNFNIYPAVTKVETGGDLGLQGTKTFDQVVIPESASIKELPPITFSYFDPLEKAYRIVSHPATPLVVRPDAGRRAPPTIVAGAGGEDTGTGSATDIVHIKPWMGTISGSAVPWIQRPWFLVLQAVPWVAWIGAALWRRQQDRLAGNPRLRRAREVEGTIREGLAELPRLAADNDAEGFFAVVFRLLQDRIGERLDVPSSGITGAVVEEQLPAVGVPAETLDTLRELFAACDQARYAPRRPRHELTAFIPKVKGALEALRKLPARPPA